MKKATLFPLLFLITFGFVLAQKLESSPQKSASEGLLKTPLSCIECKEIIDLFHDSFEKGMPINSIDFFPMKALVQNCYQNNFKECGGKMEKQLNLLLGNLEGGPLSQGSTSSWRMPVRTDLSRLTINKFDAITNFKQSYNENLVKDCSECTEIVDRLYSSYTNRTNLNESELTNLKNKAQVCLLQKDSGCGSKMEKQLKTLSGDLGGGPTSYGSDSKWRISSEKLDPFTPEFKDLKLMLNGDVIFSYKGLYGVKDNSDLVFIYPKYDNIEYVNFNNSNYLIVKKDKKEGVIDLFENFKLPIEYLRIQSNPLIPNFLIFRSLDRKNGVILGDFLKKDIESNFIYFIEKFIVIERDNKYGFLDDDGTIKIEPHYDKVDFIGSGYMFTYFTLEDYMLSSGGGSIESRYIPSNNVLVVQKDNKFGLVGENLKEILPPKYDKIGHINLVTSTSVKGLIPIWENGKMGYVNDLGDILIAPKYDVINGFGIKGWLKGELSYVSIDNKWGLFSNKNRVELTPIKYDNILFNQDGFFNVKINNKVGLVDFQGKEIFKPQYDEIIELKIDDGYYRLKNDGLFGLAKKDGVIISDPIFQGIEKNLLFWNVTMDSKVGLLNNNGSLILQPKYQEIKTFNKGLASVKLENKFGLIDQQGVEVIKPLFDSPIQFFNNLAIVSIDGKSFRIDQTGQVVPDFVSIGSIDIKTFDLGEFNYYQAKNAIESLGDGWRLPTESELLIMFNNQDKIGQLRKKPVFSNQNQIFWGSYLGGSFSKYFVTMNNSVNPGLTYSTYWGENRDKLENQFYLVRAVRDNGNRSLDSKTSENSIFKSILSDPEMMDKLVNAILSNILKELTNPSSTNNNSNKNIHQTCRYCNSKKELKYNKNGEFTSPFAFAGSMPDPPPIFCSEECYRNFNNLEH